MTTFATSIRPHVERELRESERLEAAGELDAAFACLERAHVLGQPSTVLHVRVHWKMLLWGIRRRSVRECAGQVLRIVGAATKTFLGLVPEGNTGGANVSAVRVLPVPPELQRLLDDARRGQRSSS